ncbi:hypothetical protein F5882DRAFT_457647 [Hyaloscypha sp. PMI_1271]|nr:hypothetical protein F5882DRAFT_457647 [Hyaloscypha sp. PMI_1271]
MSFFANQHENSMVEKFDCKELGFCEALCVYHEKNIFRLTLRNWLSISFRVKKNAIQSIRHLHIRLFDGIISPTEAPKCLQSPLAMLSRIIIDDLLDLLDLLTQLRSNLLKTLSLESLGIFAEVVEGASHIIGAIIKLFYRTAPKLRKVVVKFRLHKHESQQLATMRQMNDYLQDRTQNVNFRKQAIIELLNDRLARKEKALASSKGLKDLNEEIEKCGEVISESLSAMKEDS